MIKFPLGIDTISKVVFLPNSSLKYLVFRLSRLTSLPEVSTVIT